MITLIGEKLAFEDIEFTYLGSINECKNCKLKTVCFNLKPGRNYKISKIRDKKHNCNVHDGNAVIVEVSEQPFIAAISKDLPMDTKLKVEITECKSIGCDFYDICNNKALQNGKTYAIKKTIEKIECPLEYELFMVELKD